MKKNSEDSNIDFDEAKVTSYFPQLFVGKLVAFMQGEPSAYIDQKVLFDAADPNSDTYFQYRIKAAVTAAHSEGYTGEGIDISRMFDQIDLAGDFLDLESQGKSEYALAEENSELTEARIHNILRQVAKGVLTADRSELNDAFQQLLNKVLPSIGYSGLLEEYKPASLNLPNVDSMSAEEIEQHKLVIAKQRLAYAFINSVIVCYGQKLIDLNDQKFPIGGWDMGVKSFADETELAAHEFSEKLTVVRVGSGADAKCYVYGNGDGSDWQLREIEPSLLPDVKFAVNSRLSSKRLYKMTQDNIARVGAHTLSQKQKIQNEQNEERYLRNYVQVISPIQIISQKPITEDSFIVNTKDLKSTAELAQDLEPRRLEINSRLASLSQYREKISDPVLGAKIDKYAALYRVKQGEVEVIDFLLREKGNPRENILSVLDTANESEDELAAIEVFGNLQIFAERVQRDIREEEVKEDTENFETASVTSQSSISQNRARTLLGIIEKEQAQISQGLQSDNLNIDKYKQSPAYLLALMQKSYVDLAIMARHIEEVAINQEVGDALSLDVLDEVRKLTMLEQELIQTNAGIDETEESRKAIEKAQNFVNSPINVLASKFSVALGAEDIQQMQAISQKLESLPEKEMIKLKLMGLQTKLAKGSEAYASILEQIESDLDYLEVATEEELAEYSEISSLYAAAEKVYVFEKVPSSHIVQKAKLKMEVKSNLDSLERVLLDNKIKANLDELIKYVAIEYKPQQAGSQSELSSEAEKVNLSSLIIGTQNDIDSPDTAVQNRARRSPIVELAARYAEIRSMAEESRPADLAKLEHSLESLVAPKPSAMASPAARSTGRFRQLLKGIISPGNSAESSQQDESISNESPESNAGKPKSSGKL